MTLIELLKERLQAWDPSIDLEDEAFKREVLAPLESRLLEDVPVTDIYALIQRRLAAEAPHIQGSVLADVFGRIAALIVGPLHEALADALSRRRLDDPRILSGSDLEDSRDVFLVPVSQGRLAEGMFRVYLATPRNLTLDPTDVITVVGTSGNLLYRPVESTTFPVSLVKQQKDGSSYYVEALCRATLPGSEYNWEPYAIKRATGIPGATRVTNSGRVSGGESSDDTTSFLNRIRGSLTLRSAATSAGLHYLLSQAGIEDVQVIETGEPELLRDRIYGPTYIGGVPGGFRATDDATGLLTVSGSISLGVAFDVWLGRASSPDTQSVTITALLDEGFVLLEGDTGRFEDVAHPVTDNALPSDQYAFRCGHRSFGIVLYDPDSLPPFDLHTFSVYPARAGDVLEVEGLVDGSTGVRTRFPLTSLGTGILTGGVYTTVVVDTDSALTSVVSDSSTVRWRVLRVNTLGTDEDRLKPRASIYPHTDLPAFCVPLDRLRAKNGMGSELKVGNYYALTKPGTVQPERVSALTVPKTFNVVNQDAPPPVPWASRVELLDPLTLQPREDGLRSYIYPATPLFAEFLEARTAATSVSGSQAVRLRVHLFGPQAAAFHPEMAVGVQGDSPVIEGSEEAYTAEYPGDPTVGYDATSRPGPWRPLGWAGTSYTVTPADELEAETDRVVVSTEGYFEEPLVDGEGETVWDDDGARVPRVGDWLFFVPNAHEDVSVADTAEWPDPYITYPDHEFASATRAFPIVEIVDGETVRVEAPDLPSGEEGTLYLVQGCSRRTTQEAGRGPEGTYYVDVFIALATPEGDPLLDQPPFMNTPAVLDERELVMQGFQIMSPDPGLFFSTQERSHLIFPTGYVNDGEELSGRAITVYGPSAQNLIEVDELINETSVRAINKSGAVKLKPPVRCVLAVYFESETLSAASAAEICVESFETARTQGRLDVSDMKAALEDGGASYISTGRVFAHTTDYLRKHWYEAEKGSIPLPRLQVFVPDTIHVVRLSTTLRLVDGRAFDELDAANHLETYTYQWGGFRED